MRSQTIYIGGQNLFRFYEKTYQSLILLNDSINATTIDDRLTLYANYSTSKRDFEWSTVSVNGAQYVTSNSGAVLTPFNWECPRFIELPIHRTAGLSHRTSNVQKAFAYAFRYNLTIIFNALSTTRPDRRLEHTPYLEADELLTYGLGELNEYQWNAMKEWSKQFPNELNLTRLLKEVNFNEWMNGQYRNECYVLIHLHESWKAVDYPEWSYAHNQRKVTMGWRKRWQTDRHWMDAHVNAVIPNVSSYRSMQQESLSPSSLSTNASPLLIGMHIRGGDRPQNIRWFVNVTSALCAVLITANVPFHIFVATDQESFIPTLIASFQTIMSVRKDITVSVPSFFTTITGEQNPVDLILAFSRMDLIITGPGSGYSALIAIGFHKTSNRLMIGPGGYVSFEGEVQPFFAPSIIRTQFHSVAVDEFDDILKVNEFAKFHISKHSQRNFTLFTEQCRILPNL